VVFFTGILAPGMRLVLLGALIPIRLNRVGRGSCVLFRRAADLVPWRMMDVFMLGILVSVVKLGDRPPSFREPPCSRSSC